MREKWQLPNARPAASPQRWRLPPIYDEASHWYLDWYFDLRLEEEVHRSLRYKVPLSLVVLSLTGPARKDRRHLNATLSGIVATSLRRSDIAGRLGAGEFGVILPHTGTQQAETVARRLRKAFEPFAIAAGIAGCPEDAQSPIELLALAQQRASLEGDTQADSPKSPRRHQAA